MFIFAKAVDMIVFFIANLKGGFFDTCKPAR
jgi:hypothetical protein